MFTDAGLLIGILTFRGTAGEELNYAVPTEWVEQLLAEDSAGRVETAERMSFWEDSAPAQASFLQAAWLEAAQAWTQLEAFDRLLFLLQRDRPWFAGGGFFLLL